ncbi:MAG: alpha-amylase family protein [Muribaculaceae bacterium]|nr:alpha-amylase family protein [Muribaculaceae bacterium]
MAKKEKVIIGPGHQRPIIYQTFPRIFTNTNSTNKFAGTLEENGAGKLNDITPTMLRSLKGLGINCIWLTGVIEHATKSDFRNYGIPLDNPNVVKGEAGSPYAIKDYYDIDPAIAVNPERRMEEFEECVKRIHAAGMKVIIDFVPNHTARIYHSDVAPEGIEDFGASDNRTYFFSPSNNYYYIPNQQFSPDFCIAAEGNEAYVEFPAKATGNDCFSAFCGKNDWYETVKLNYGHDYGDHSDHFEPVPDTWLKMLHILRFWASKGVDGFRCDMVFMVPLPFWHWAIPQVKETNPDLLFIGEIYDVGQYRPFLDYGHFDYLYDKVNLYDKIVGIERYNYSAAQLTPAWQTVDGISDRMLNFLENHDEVRYGSVEFAGDPSKVVPALVVSSMMSCGPYMIYYGQELGERATENEGFAGFNNRSTIFDYWSYDPIRRWYADGKCSISGLNAHEKWLRGVYAKILKLCNENSALREGSFFDLMYANLGQEEFDPHSCFCFLRYSEDSKLLIIVNFSEEERRLKINIPALAFDMAALKEGKIKEKDLLWGESYHINLSRTSPLSISIKGRDAIILPIGDAKQEDLFPEKIAKNPKTKGASPEK